MDSYQGQKENLRQNIYVISVVALLISGGFLLLIHGKNFLIALKPGYDVEYVMNNGAKKGMHVKGEVDFLYDSFAQMENTGNHEISAFYYALPAGEGLIALYVPEDRNGAAQQLLAETYAFVEQGTLPVTTLPVEGYIVEAQGRIPYLLTQYMAEIGYSEEDIQAMGTPLMLQEATEAFRKARICAPAGVICLALAVLLILYGVFRSRFRRS